MKLRCSLLTFLIAVTISLPAGPLRIHPTNQRYFTDGSKSKDGSLRAVYLTGSHHWHNLQDAGRIGKPLTKIFEYDAYLERLGKLNYARRFAERMNLAATKPET